MSILEDIKNRLAAATPGPWTKDPDEPVHIMKPDKPGFSWDGTVIATLQRDDFGLFEEANADLIAHAPEDIARLVKALEAVQELHRKFTHHFASPPAGSVDVCFSCREPYPCPTLTTITEALDS